jgi:hypothetical protein
MIAKIIVAVGVVCLVVAACSSGPSGPVGGPVAGAADTHCALADGGTRTQPTSQASCVLTPGGDAGVINYGATMFNSEADDDDCKYHLKWSATAIQENSNVTFTAVATNKGIGTPATGANLDLEIFLNPTHPAPNTPVKTTESPPGTYQVGPVQFDAKGEWTVRFHLFETCADTAPDSPHGHVAFFVDVP